MYGENRGIHCPACDNGAIPVHLSCLGVIVPEHTHHFAVGHALFLKNDTDGCHGTRRVRRHAPGQAWHRTGCQNLG